MSRRPVASPFPTVVPLVPPASARPCRAPATGRPDSPASRLGAQIRTLRLASGASGGRLAQNAGISRSLLSRIERGLVSPSVQTLEHIARALDVAISRFFADQVDRTDFCLVRSGKGLQVGDIGANAAHSIELLGHLRAGSMCVEPCRVRLDSQARPLAIVQHPGLKFLFMQSGRARYRYGTREVEVGPGDALLFDATAMHGLEAITEPCVSYLSIVFSLSD